jgi:hypothetical protein
MHKKRNPVSFLFEDVHNTLFIKKKRSTSTQLQESPWNAGYKVHYQLETYTTEHKAKTLKQQDYKNNDRRNSNYQELIKETEICKKTNTKNTLTSLNA